MTYEQNEAQEISGCTDWDGDVCYECGEPVGEESWDCILDYDDPLAAVLGKCENCNAPRYQVLGHCPACKGPVYELADHFACYNTFSGACDFRIPIERMEECELWPFYINMMHLLHRGLELIESSENKITHATLNCADDGWDVMIVDGPLSAKVESISIGSSVGTCIVCGESVINMDDRLVCSSALSSVGCIITREVDCEEITFGESDPDYDPRARTTPDGFSVGACPVCGESVINMDDRFACSSGLSSGGCNFYILKDGIYDVIEDNIIAELHDMFIYNDSGLAETMSDLLSWKGPGKASHEYYQSSYMGKPIHTGRQRSNKRTSGSLKFIYGPRYRKVLKPSAL